jgi:hypothetical protein
MGCGCAKRASKSRQKQKAARAKKNGSVIRKRRISKLISVPGTSSRRKTATTDSAEEIKET